MSEALILCPKVARINTPPKLTFYPLDVLAVRYAPTLAQVAVGNLEPDAFWFLGVSGFPDPPVADDIYYAFNQQDVTLKAPDRQFLFGLGDGASDVGTAKTNLKNKDASLNANLNTFLVGGAPQALLGDVEVRPWATVKGWFFSYESGVGATGGQIGDP